MDEFMGLRRELYLFLLLPDISDEGSLSLTIFSKEGHKKVTRSTLY